jgi:hypothetical protein
MKVTGALLAAVLGCGSSGAAPIANAQPTPARRGVILIGVVHDYRDRPVAGARVRGDGREVTSDAHGRFTLEVPARSHVSASKHDMLGSITAGSELEQRVVIRMMQMPE